jgi:hypothetical protein
MPRTAPGAVRESPSSQAPPVSWSEEENARLRAAVGTWGTSSWTKVAKLVGNRRAAQACRGRWRRLLAAEAESTPSAVSVRRVTGQKRKRNSGAVVAQL